MKFSTVATLFAASALAAPAPEPEIHSQMVAAAPQWTMVRLSRPCNAANTQCTWKFNINEHNGAAPQVCSFVVKGSPASQTNSANNQCGAFTIGTGWSGQFGPGNGFTTLSVVNNTAHQIIYPSYTDKQLANGATVTPNQNYAPAALP